MGWINRFMGLVFFLSLFSLAGFTQTPQTVSGTVLSPSGGGCPGGSSGSNCQVRFRLRNYSGIAPRVPGIGLIQTSVLVTPNGSGAFSTPLYTNDVIQPNNCGLLNNQPCTWYAVDFLQGGQEFSSNNWQLTGGGPFDLNTLAPLTGAQPPPPPFLPVLLNPLGEQKIAQYGLQMIYTDYPTTTVVNPVAGVCRSYFNGTTMTFVNSVGGVCGPTGGGGGGSGITGTLTSAFLPKATSTGLNGTVGNSDVAEGSIPNIVSDAGVDFLPRQDYVNFADAFNWTQSPAGSISPGSNTITLVPCPYGLSGANAFNTSWGTATYLHDSAPESSPNYYILLAGTGTTEAPAVTATTCTPGAASGTITFTALNSHSAGYTVGSSTAGYQEALNDCELMAGQPSASPIQCIVKGQPSIGGTTPGAHPAALVYLYAPIVTHGSWITIDCQNQRLYVAEPQQGIVLGDRNLGENILHHNFIKDCRIGPGYVATAPQINLIQSVTQAGAPGPCTYTVTFTSNHDFTLTYPWIYIGGMLSNNSVAGVRQITSIPAANQIQFQTLTCLSWTTPTTVVAYAGGYAVLEYVGVEDNLSTDGDFIGSMIDNVLAGANDFHAGWVTIQDEQNIFERVSMEYTAIRTSTAAAQFSEILGPGPSGQLQGGQGILKITDSTIQGSCGYNPIDWWDGNDLTIENSLIQNWEAFAVRAQRRRGGFGGFTSTGNHYENGCGPGNNKMGVVGQAGLISSMATNKLESDAASPPQGNTPLFASIGDHLLQWVYYVEPNQFTSDTFCTVSRPNEFRCTTWNGNVTNAGNGPLLPAGYAAVDSGTGGTVNVTWPAVRGATSYNLYRISVTDTTKSVTVPYGQTGNYLISGALNPVTVCTDTLCTFSDSVGLTPTNTTVPNYSIDAGARFAPYLDYWPGAVVLTKSADFNTNNFGNGLPYFGDAPITGSSFITTSPPQLPGVTFTSVYNVAASNQSFGAFSYYQLVNVASPSATAPQSAQLTPAVNFYGPGGDSGVTQNLKGILNFGYVSSPTYPFDITTYQDSNYTKTLSTVSHRPPADAADCAFGLDQSNGLSERCATSISLYINSLNDNSSYKARLTNSGMAFNVPVTVGGGSSQVTMTTPTTVGALPSAAGNPLAIMGVSDSTAVAAEGQVCVGGSTHKAIAISDGSVWKCF